jgi:alginate O-acetyltransferase complex protein AlgI
MVPRRCELFFFGFWDVNYVPIVILSPIFNFYLARLIAYSRIARLPPLWFGISANLAVLVYFKYYNYFAATLMNLAAAAGLHINTEFIELSVPLAISFLTFHVLAYLIDVYKRRLAPASSLVDILLYVTFFPHLVAGPIIRPKSFLEQAMRKAGVSDVRVARSVFLVISGLFKKVVLANYIATDFVDNVFRVPTNYSSLDLLFGMYGYGLQIYCDFSGYTDIAIGIANFLGYNFPENFDRPYRAVTLQEFWRRWRCLCWQH